MNQKLSELLPTQADTQIIQAEEQDFEDSKGTIKKVGEFYFWKVENQLVPVCGFKGKDGDFCRKQPGAGTAHKGVGFCLNHSSGGQDRKLLQKISNQLADTNTFKERMLDTLDLTQEDLCKVDDDLRILYSLLLTHTGELVEGQTLNPTAEKQVLKIMDRIFKGKLIRARIENLNKIDSAYVLQMIDIFLSIVQKIAPQQAQRIGEELLSTLKPGQNEVIQSGYAYAMEPGTDKIERVDLDV